MCRTGCPTGDHATWGECARAANLRIAYCRSQAGWDATKQRRWDNELARFRSAVSQGIRPDQTTTAAIERAEKLSEYSGVPYGTREWDNYVARKAAESSE